MLVAATAAVFRAGIDRTPVALITGGIAAVAPGCAAAAEILPGAIRPLARALAA
jgi:hypothetical protein